MSHFSFLQSQDAGIKTITMLDEQGGESCMCGIEWCEGLDYLKYSSYGLVFVDNIINKLNRWVQTFTFMPVAFKKHLFKNSKVVQYMYLVLPSYVFASIFEY